MDTTEQEHQLEELATNCIQTDPDRFQARSEYPRGVRDTDLSSVSVFNPMFAGVISVWRDPETQVIYVVDGHRRLELARRTNTPRVLVQFLKAETDAEAFATGVLISVAQWIFNDDADRVTWACASRRAAVERALYTEWLDPGSEAACELYKYYPDLGRRYNAG